MGWRTPGLMETTSPQETRPSIRSCHRPWDAVRGHEAKACWGTYIFGNQSGLQYQRCETATTGLCTYFTEGWKRAVLCRKQPPGFKDQRVSRSFGDNQIKSAKRYVKTHFPNINPKKRKAHSSELIGRNGLHAAHTAPLKYCPRLQTGTSIWSMTRNSLQVTTKCTCY